ncbi:probable serine/threonine-protein kinase WNK6 isoform X1 [Miscanthus floridulus]|uniref:probable serine/threonine-protein kinase WNK6 isoform X1 n=1 Tax=Miscanthus floridulus TaxID=154761 RepID=UPI0034598F30
MAPDPDLAGGEQAEPPDDEVDDPDVDEVDPTGPYFRYKEVLGSGAFKTVYLRSLSSAVYALQRLRRGGSHRGGMGQSLQHKHILKLYASWLDKKKRTVNIVTELFTSGNLRENVPYEAQES